MKAKRGTIVKLHNGQELRFAKRISKRDAVTAAVFALRHNPGNKKESLSDLQFKAYRLSRLGLTFTEVRRDLALEQARKRDNYEYMFVTRKTVLGRMNQIKRQLFNFDQWTRQQLLDYIADIQQAKGAATIYDAPF